MRSCDAAIAASGLIHSSKHAELVNADAGDNGSSQASSRIEIHLQFLGVMDPVDASTAAALGDMNIRLLTKCRTGRART